MNSGSRRDTRPLGSQRLVKRFATRQGMRLLVTLSLISLVVAVLGGWYLLGLFPVGAPGSLQVTVPASLDELATQYPQLASILQNSELDSVYKDFLLAYHQGGIESARQFAQERGLLNDQDELLLTLELDTSDHTPLVEQLESLGVRVTTASENLVDIAVTMQLIDEALQAGDAGGLLDDLTALEHVIRVRFSPPTIGSVGDVETESLAVIQADAWQAAGFSGKGIKVGVIDIGFDHYRDLLGADLPANVTARSFTADTPIDQTGSVHGTACAEIIHDIAPDAELFFTIYDTQAERRLAVDWLMSQGVNIISHSRSGMYGPMDGTGEFARLVEDKVASRGVLWVNAAGNYAERHYRGTFTDEDGDGFHEFAPGEKFLPFSPSYGDNTVIFLNWDAWETGDQDYDLYVYDRNSKEVVRSYNTQSGRGSSAAEWIDYKFPGSGPYYIAFYARRITRPGVFDLYIHPDKLDAYATADHSIGTPSDAFNALAVGAVFWSTDVLEKYSSQGPSNDGRIKPDLSAPAGVSSAAYGRSFSGTSAAAPHVAGAAALIWEANPTWTMRQVSEFLKGRARDLGTAGPDTHFGYGRLWLGPVSPAGVLPEATPAETSQATQLATPFQTATYTQPPPAAPTWTFAPTGTPGATPVSGASSADLWMISLGFMVCVAVPGLVGIGGLGLVGFLWYQSSAAHTGPARRRPRALPIRAQPAVLDQPARPVRAQPAALDQLAQPEYKPHFPQEMQTAPGQAVCPRCQAPYKVGIRFCRICGLSLLPEERLQQGARYCTNCGQALRPVSKFCPRCGKPR
ncbi:MAG: S8 family serine peptidase [Chloroflexota bacterium]